MADVKRTNPLRIAPSPFDSRDKADFILHTSDDIHFHVYKALLILASRFFSNLLSDGTPDEYYDKLPLYQVPESSSTMTVVLRLCYPINIDAFELLDGGGLDEQVLSALDKYLMDGPLTRLRELISASRFTKKKPLQAFGLARRLGCDDVARTAARRLLAQVPFVDMSLQADELKMISTYELGLLLKYRHACGLAALKVIDTQGGKLLAGKALSKARFSIWPSRSCSACSVDSKLEIGKFESTSKWTVMCCPHDWFRAFLTDVAPMLRDSPRKQLAVDFIDDALFRVNPNCPSQTVAGIKAILQALDKDIRSEVEKVSLGI